MRRFVFVIAATFATWLLLYLSVRLSGPHHAPTGLPGFLHIDRPVMLAHRGSRHLYAENTIEAQTLALSLGTDVLEMDVRLTKDLRVVVHHDAGVERTTEGDGLIAHMTLEEIQALDAGHDFAHEDTFPLRGTGHTVPTFKEMMHAFPTQNINVEIKENDVELALHFAQDIAELEKEGLSFQDRMVVCSYWCEPLQAFRDAAPSIATSACAEESTKILLLSWLHCGPLVAALRWAGLLHVFSFSRASLVQIPARSGTVDLTSAAIIDNIHAMGLKVHYWVINDAQQMERLLLLGADGIISDRIDRLRRVFEALNIVPSLDSPSDLPYFIPEHGVEEVHTCVTWLCMATEVIPPVVLVPLMVAALLMGMVLISMCVCPPRASESPRAVKALRKKLQ